MRLQIRITAAYTLEGEASGVPEEVYTDATSLLTRLTDLRAHYGRTARLAWDKWRLRLTEKLTEVLAVNKAALEADVAGHTAARNQTRHTLAQVWSIASCVSSPQSF
jgi:hypothetical protein